MFRELYATQLLLKYKVNYNFLRSSTGEKEKIPENCAKTIIFGEKTVSWQNLKVQLCTPPQEILIHLVSKEIE